MGPGRRTPEAVQSVGKFCTVYAYLAVVLPSTEQQYSSIDTIDDSSREHTSEYSE